MAHDARPNPWRCRSRETRYDNPWIRLEHHDVVTPSGSDGIYGVVRFKNLAVGVIPLDDELNTWIVGQYRYPLDRYSWEIPEGGAPHGEDPLAAAQRELREEVGIEARDWEPLVEMDLSNSVSDERAIIYVARQLSFGAAAPEETEQLEVRKLPFEQLYRDVLEGRVRDSLTVAGVLRLKLRLLESR
jgi:8-oxo-dGTP pyrophosphatase MutT (NUDIX family)